MTSTSTHTSASAGRSPGRKTRRDRLTRTALALSCTCALGFFTLSAAPARAGFLEDYYDAAGAQTAVTQPAVVQSQSVNLVTGGSFMLKTPRKTFQPFSLEAPHLKAGCGGIDVFLGSFSLPSKEEFVSYLRSIGTALPGVAYQLALQGMSPDLNEIVAEYRDLLMRVTNGLTDSCSTAETLLSATGAADHLKAAGHWARGKLRESGEASDASEADDMTKTDGAAVIENVPERKDTGGNVVQAAEMNLTWTLLKGGKLASADTENLEVIMTMLGTTVYRKSGSGENTTITSEDFAPADLLHALYATGTDANAGKEKTEIDALVCDEPVKCLNPKKGKLRDVNLVTAIKTASLHYRDSLIQANRGGVTEEEILMLANISSLPLLSLIEATASPRFPGLSDAYIQIFAEAAAYEGIMRALTDLSKSAMQMVKASSGSTASAELQAHAEKLQDRVLSIQSELLKQESNLKQSLANAQALSAQVDYIRRSVYGQAAAEIASQMPGIPPVGGQ